MALRYSLHLNFDAGCRFISQSHNYLHPWILDLVSIFDVGTISGSFPYLVQRKRDTKAPERVESSNRKDEAALQLRCALG